MASLYYATSQKPSSVTHAAVGCFTSGSTLNLVLGLTSRLELYSVSDGLQALASVPLHGRIATLSLVRPSFLAADAPCMLLIVTERSQFMVLRWDAAAQSLVTEAAGDMRDRLARPVARQTCAFDPYGRCALVHCYEGLVKVIPCDKGWGERVSTLRIPDHGEVLDLAFVWGSLPPAPPVLAVLYARPEAEGPLLLTFALLPPAPAAMAEGGSAAGGGAAGGAAGGGPRAPPRDARTGYALEPGALHLNAPPGTSHLVPLPHPTSALLLTGGRDLCTISTSAAGVPRTAAPSASAAAAPSPLRRVSAPRYLTPRCHSVMDAGRVLLGAADGTLYLIGCAAPSAPPECLRLGETVQPSTLSYLHTGHVFVGSVAGDSVLLRLKDVGSSSSSSSSSSAPAPLPSSAAPSPAPPCYFEAASHYPSLGPIVDMVVMDVSGSEAAGGAGSSSASAAAGGHASQIVTASGTGKDGSLRVVRAGIGLAELAAVDLEGIRGLWSVCGPSSASEGSGSSSGSGAAVHSWLVQSYASHTRVLAWEGEEMNEISVSGLTGAAPTLCVGNVGPAGAGWAAAVSSTGVTIVPVGGGGGVLAQWRPAGGARVTLGAVTATHVLCALGGGVVVLLAVNGVSGELCAVSTRGMGAEVSCLGLLHTARAGGSSALFAAVGLWSPSATLAILALQPELAVVHEECLSELVGGGGEVAGAGGAGAGGGMTDALPAGSSSSGGGGISTPPPRAVLSVQYSPTSLPHVLIGMGDGNLFSFRLQASGGLSDRRKMSLGRSPISLATFRIDSVASAAATAAATAAAGGSSGGAPPPSASTGVFVSCDRPTVITRGSSGRLVFAPVNTPASAPVRHMAPLHTPHFPNCLALASDAGLTISSPDTLARLHVRSIPLGEQPRRLAHFKAGRCIVVACEGLRPAPAPSGGGAGAGGLGAAPQALVEVSSLRAYDDGDFAPLLACASFELDPCEIVMALAQVPLASESGVGVGAKLEKGGGTDTQAPLTTPYLLAGTAYVLEDEEECSKGRILVLSVEGEGAARRLHIVGSVAVRGAVTSLCPIGRGRLVAGVNARVCVYTWELVGARGEEEEGMGGSAAAPTGALTLAAQYKGHIMSAYLDTALPSTILVGDVMKSLTLLHYDSAANTLRESAEEPGNNWMTAVACVGGGVYLGSDHNYNLFSAVPVTAVAGGGEAASPSSASASASASAAAAAPSLAMALDEGRLSIAAQFYSGEFINRFRAGSLLTLPVEGEDGAGEVVGSGTAAGAPGGGSAPRTPTPRLVFGAISGALGVIISLPPATHALLQAAQESMGRVVQGVGGLSHAAWRAFFTEQRPPAYLSGGPGAASAGIIDGDFLELLLDMEGGLQEAVVADMNGGSAGSAGGAGACTVSHLLGVIEHLASLH